MGSEKVQIGNNEFPTLLREQDLQQIRESLRGLRYGLVNIVVQDGVIVQIDRTEKRRIRRDSGR
ncbi:MAG: YezD family protein [Pirellulaceae bacterium]